MPKHIELDSHGRKYSVNVHGKYFRLDFATRPITVEFTLRGSSKTESYTLETQDEVAIEEGFTKVTFSSDIDDHTIAYTVNPRVTRNNLSQRQSVREDTRGESDTIPNNDVVNYGPGWGNGDDAEPVKAWLVANNHASAALSIRPGGTLAAAVGAAEIPLAAGDTKILPFNGDFQIFNDSGTNNVPYSVLAIVYTLPDEI